MANIVSIGFAKALEKRRDYRGALQAYSLTGFEKEALRVKRILDIIETSKKLREISIIRAADLLLENGLVTETRELVTDIEKRDTDESNYAKLRILAIDSMSVQMRETCMRLDSFGSYGKYLTAMALIKESPNAARIVADYLSRKETTDAIEEHKMFFLGNDKEEITRCMRSFLHMKQKGEAEYFAMRIYEKLEAHEDQLRCRQLLADATDEIKFYAAFDSEGRFREEELNIKLTNSLRFIYAIWRGEVDKIIDLIERVETDDDGKYRVILDLVCDLDKFLPQIISDRDILKLLEYMKSKKKVLAQIEEEKLIKFEALLNEAGENLEKIKEASEFLGGVKFTHLKSNYWDYMKKCADSAFSLGTKEALVFAAKIYDNVNVDLERAFDCADILLEKGCIEEAKMIYANLAISLGKKYKEDKNILIAQKLLKRATELEDIYPTLSMYIYKELNDIKAVKRTAEIILQNGTEKDLEAVGWTLSTINKRGELMHKILQRLKEKGKEGERKAQGIIREMKIPALYVVT